MQTIIQKIRLLDTTAASASYNMAVDEMLLQNSIESGIPVLRLYEWDNSISLGRFSKPHDTLDLNKLKRKKLSYARRLTGGGVLVHGGDISYSLILPQNILGDLGVKESYRYLCSFLLNLYRKLGLDPQFAQDAQLNISKSNICTASNEPYDITIDTKKIGGNAQRYTKGTLFQHGSIPLQIDTELFEGIFAEDPKLGAITTLEKLGISLTKEKLKKLMIHSFMESFDVELIEDRFTQQELKQIGTLQKQKYDKDEWNIDALHL
ncbi:MAG: lipoate--protein ligase family protein [Sulfurimonas sp.]